MCRAMPFLPHTLKQNSLTLILWWKTNWNVDYPGLYSYRQRVRVFTLSRTFFPSLFMPVERVCKTLWNRLQVAHLHNAARFAFNIIPRKFSLEFKAMLQKSIFLATLHATMTTKNPFKLQKGCPMLATFFATCNAHNNKQDGGNLPWAKDEFWLAHSGKIELQVAEGMLHASNVSQRCEKLRVVLLFLQVATQQ